MKTIKTKQIKWIDISKPSELEVEYLRKNFNFAPAVLKEYLPPLKRPKVDQYSDHLFIVLHFPVFDKETRETSSAELDVILTRDTIITSHSGNLPQLKKFFDDCNIHDQLRKQYLEKGIGFLLFQILDKMIDSRLPMLDHIAENIDQIENEVFQGNEREMISEISIVKKDIIDFRKTIKPQRVVLETLDKIISKFCQEDLKIHSQEVIGSNIRVWNTLENNKEMIEAIERTNESLFYYKFNETLKILTVFSVIMLPLTLIASIFGMNLIHSMPFMKSFCDFWWVILMMAISSIIMIVYFKKKKWL
jgi:magnesium transporter